MDQPDDADRFRRTPAKAGRVSGKRLPACRHCGAPPPKGRRTFCSDDCVHEWKIRTNPGYAASQVLKRDRGVCSICHVDCVALQAELKRLRRDELETTYPQYWPYQREVLRGTRDILPRWNARCDEVGLSEKRRNDLSRRLWEMDHIVPVAEGGGSCDLRNLRTVCLRCHGIETAKLRSRLSEARRQQADRAGAPAAGKPEAGRRARAGRSSSNRSS